MYAGIGASNPIGICRKNISRALHTNVMPVTFIFIICISSWKIMIKRSLSYCYVSGLMSIFIDWTFIEISCSDHLFIQIRSKGFVQFFCKELQFNLHCWRDNSIALFSHIIISSSKNKGYCVNEARNRSINEFDCNTDYLI